MKMLRCAALVIGGLVACTPIWAQPQSQSASPNSASSDAANANASAPAQAAAPATLIVPAGTRLPLVLHNTISTRNAHAGDPVYLETTFPILLNGRIVVPAGSYVQGEILDFKRPGKVKGQGEVRVHLTTMILPNGYTVSFDAAPAGAEAEGKAANSEGQVSGDPDRSKETGTVLATTTSGAVIGGIAGHNLTGVGLGAGVGAAAGAGILMAERGPDLDLARGASVEIELDRPLYLDASKINFTDPGHASALPEPANRGPARGRF